MTHARARRARARLDCVRLLSVLIERAISGKVGAPVPMLARAVRAAAGRDAAALRRLRAEVARDPNSFDPYTVWSVVAMAENPAAARLLGESMLSGKKGPGERLWLRSALGSADLAAGQWRSAARELRQAREDAERAGASYDEERLLWMTAAWAALPSLPVPQGDVVALRRELARWHPVAPPPSAIPSPIAPLRSHLRLYLLGILDAHLGAYDTAAREAGALEGLPSPPGDAATVDLLARVLRASVASQLGEHAPVLNLLERSRGQLQPMTHTAIRFGDIQARGRRAEALRGLGRDAEAIHWYRATTQGVEYGGASELALMGPSLLRQAELRERRGDSTTARLLYATVADLWAEADPEARALARSAAEHAVPAGDTPQRAFERRQERSRE